MALVRRACVRALAPAFALLLFVAASLPVWAAPPEKPRLRVDDYVIDAELVPTPHRLVAKAKVKFTALDDLSVATFELNNALRPTKITDEAGHTLSAERVTQDSTIRVSLPNGLAKGVTSTLTFDYEGTLETGDDSPVQGLKLAYVGQETSYLLYASRWFPVSGYGINRFTATMNITVPAHMVVIGSGKVTVSGGAPTRASGRAAKAAEKAAAESGATKTYTLVYDKPSFPGTIIAGQFDQTKFNEGGLNLQVFFKPVHKNAASVYGETAAKKFYFFTSLFGPPLSSTLNVVEIPDDTVPSAWAPDVVALSSHAITPKVNYRLLANTIAHQWWGADISPASRNDWWLSDGFARYSEAMYVEHAAGQAGLEEVAKDMSAGALAYDTVPLSQAGKLDPFSPEFQSLVTDKGAMILHMLRWIEGDSNFYKTLRAFATQYAGKAATVDDFREVAEKNSGQQLTWFFTQWLDSTGAPEFKDKYTVYRLGNGKGFRVVGEIAQDLDLFRMPVELKIDTDGKTEVKRIEVVGTQSAYTVDTYGKPRRIVIDPDDHVLKNSPDLKVRTSILRGQQLVQTGDLPEALREFQKALESNKNSSLAHYRIAEVFFLQHNYQAAANAYREALNGDGEPKWTEVWSHIQLGKIFDLTGQRERATNEYRQAIQTHDNTQGAMDEATRYLQTPYSAPKEKVG
ncbi:MAG TPA: M1 family aminopeptidase [Terriglobales bacterium]|nr:M1 family aminopeptidase [Terriglobales bacterium]